MKNKIVCFLSVALSLIVCAFVSYKDSIQKKLLHEKNITIKNLINTNVTLTPLFEACVMNCGIKLDEEKSKFYDTAGNVIKLKDLVKQPTLFFRYSDSHCSQCINYALNLLYKSKANEQKVIYIGDNMKRKIFKKHVENMRLSGISIACHTLDLPIERMLFPYFMVIDSSLVIRGVYIPNKASYYQKIDSINFDLLYNQLIENNLY